MGGMWAAGMPLALEQWPAKHRGIASGILQGGYSTGFLLSSLVYQLGYPLISDRPDWAWRIMLWAGVLPAIVVFFLMTRVSESPLWLEQQRLRAGNAPARLSLARLFDRDLRWVTLHTSLLMGAFVWMYQSTTIWYPTLLAEPEAAAAGVPVAAECRRRDRLDRVRHALREVGRPPRRRHARHGRRRPLGAGLPVLRDQRRLMLGAWLIGFFASGAWGIVPGYLSERFPTEVARRRHRLLVSRRRRHRRVCAVPDRRRCRTAAPSCRQAMFWCIIGGGVGVVTLLWLGPETKGEPS